MSKTSNNSSNRNNGLNYIPIDKIYLLKEDNERVLLNGWVNELTEPFYVKDDEGNYNLSARAILQDKSGSTIKTTELTEEHYEELDEYRRSGRNIDATGRIIKTTPNIKKNKHVNELEIRKISTGDTPLKIIKANRKERRLVNKFLKIIKKRIRKGNRWVLIDEIKRAVVDIIGIVGASDDKLFSDVIIAMICQAYTIGQINNSSAKIHTLIIGHPASGKKLFWEIAKLINAISEEAAASRTKPTGLSGAIDRQNGMWVVIKGLIPLAHQGVFAIKDFDKVPQKDEILSILSDTMEDAKCIVTGIAKLTAQASTSIHLDVNRLSDTKLNNTHKKNITADTQIPTYIFSRIDFLVEIPKDTDKTLEKSYEIIFDDEDKRNKEGLIAKFCTKNAIDITRFLKLLSATILENYSPEVPKKTREYMVNIFKDYYANNDNSLDESTELAQFQMRMVNSFFKFTMALTRLQLKKVSTKAIAKKAFVLLSYKLDFISSIQNSSSSEAKTDGYEVFEKWAYHRLRFHPFERKNAIQYYRDDDSPAGYRENRTLHGWLKKCSIKTEVPKTYKLKPSIIKKYEKLEK